jgi:hypothetical protein
MRKSIGKQQTVRISGNLRLTDHNSTLLLSFPTSRVDVTMSREALRVELVDHHHLSAAAECEDEMEDGACCNVEVACGLVVWPVRMYVQEKSKRRGSK